MKTEGKLTLLPPLTLQPANRCRILQTDLPGSFRCRCCLLCWYPHSCRCPCHRHQWASTLLTNRPCLPPSVGAPRSGPAIGTRPNRRLRAHTKQMPNFRSPVGSGAARRRGCRMCAAAACGAGGRLLLRHRGGRRWRRRGPCAVGCQSTDNSWRK